MLERFNFRQFRVLLTTSLKIDLTSSAFSGSGSGNASASTSGLSPFSYLAMFLLGGSVVLNLFLVGFVFQLGGGPQSEVRLFANMNMLMMMVFVPMQVISEIQSTLIHPEDVEVVAPRPVSTITYFLARYANLLLYVLALTLACATVPTAAGMFLEDSNLLFGPSFLLGSLMGVFSVSGVLLLFYAILVRWVPTKFIERTITAFQFFLPVGLFLLLLPFFGLMTKGVETDSVMGLFYGLLYLLPSNWFCSISFLATGTSEPFDVHFAAIGVGTFLLFTAIPARLMADLYSQYLNRNVLQERGSGRKGTGGFLSGLVCGSQVERGAFDFFITMCAHNQKTLRQIVGQLGVLAVIILLQEIKAGVMKYFVPLGFIVFPLMTLFQIIEVSDEWKGGWVMNMAPVSGDKIGDFFVGTIKAAVVVYTLPILVVSQIVASIKAGFQYADLLLFPGLAIMVLPFFAVMFAIQFPLYPFTNKPGKGTYLNFFECLKIFAVYVPMLIVVMLHIALYRVSIPGYLAVLGVGCFLVPLGFYIARRIGLKRFKKQTYSYG